MASALSLGLVLGAVLGTLIGAALFAVGALSPHFGSIWPRRALILWSAAFALLALRFLLLWLAPGIAPGDFNPLAEVAHLAAVTLLFAGTQRYFQRPMRLGVLGLLFGGGLAWIAVSVGLGTEFLAATTPIYVFSGGMLFANAWYWLDNRQPGDVATLTLAILLSLWGLHKLDYPFLFGLSGIGPWGLVLGLTLAVASGLGLLVVTAGLQGQRCRETVRRVSELEAESAAGTAHLRTVLDTLADGVVTVDGEGVIADVNPTAVAIFGYLSAERMIGLPVSTILPDEENDYPLGGLVARLAGHPEAAAERPDSFVGMRQGGGSLPVDVRVSETTQGGRRFFVVVVRDMSEATAARTIEILGRELDQKVLGGASLGEVADHVVEALAGLTGADLSWLATRESDQSLNPRALWVAGQSVPEGIEDRLAADTASTTDILSLERSRILDLDTLPGSHATARRAGCRWLLLLPLWGQASAVGVLALGFARELPDPARISRLERLAGRIGAALRLTRDQQLLRLQGTAMDAVANAIFITRADGTIEWVNKAFCRLSGYPAEEVLGRKPSILKSGFQDLATYHDMWKSITKGAVWRGELIELRRDKTLYTVNQLVTPMVGQSGEIEHFVAVHEDITERKKADERIRYLSNYDTLTRLPNRVLFRDRLVQAVTQARRTRTKLAVLFIDMNRFSRVNDTLGHDTGDQFLMTVASRINAAAGDADTVARIGGDEFAIIQTNLENAEAAASLATRIIRTVASPVEISGQEVRVGANVGIAIYPQDGEDADHLIKNADMAMYRVIRSDAEPYCFFSNEMNDEAQLRLGLEGDLRRALELNELSLYLQPQVDTRGRRVVGFEALLRWFHPTHGNIPPARFIPVAEDSGLILSIGEWVLEQAIIQMAKWRAEGLGEVSMAVNISPVQFQERHLPDKVARMLEVHDVPAAFLELELTESVLMKDAEAAVTLLNRLSDAGIKLAVDDFGTGYSSLAYLKQFRVDKLKLDQSFVRHMDTDFNDRVIARATINLGHSLGLKVIGEGVETRTQFEMLQREGCDVVQGYLFGRPMPVDEATELLRRAGPAPFLDTEGDPPQGS
ncbi:sensor domain-containing protein [Roseospirillum parvum]|uniref:PAS domain S-box-containing protein/diguanylate cyclase (GGDEF) domain-containing protein n=1 Tax=Roseospirillum parvum TaxID=83401 RepID=A0A1G8E7V2_9PROT|nr:EAL domain-containing protein [Roseospirillum parvum]SDH65937.1 PAS domain S-box-containing protein/diguanylate cyclase (GGDEF) domain-containing protein [Roseospirillum parvum]